MIQTKLLAGKFTTKQGLLIAAWYVNLLLALVVWVTTSASLLTTGGAGSIVLAIGRMLGILATVFALTQFLLMGRILWIERPFGLDHLASYHRFNGYAAILFILLHPPFVILGYALISHTNYFAQYVDVLRNYEDVLGALVGQFLFVLVVATSIYIVRRKLKFESWYYVHLAVYAAIVLVFGHQLAIGGSFIGHPLARAYWIALYAFVGLNVLFFRFILPSLNLLRFRFKVSRVVAETPSTTSIYIRGRNLKAWPAQPGQFVLVRMLNRKYGAQEHPFSLSAVPANNEFRLTIRHSGDYTNTIAGLKPGTFVLTSGPFGRFTSTLAVTDKRLFIAGGVGITPIRTLVEEALDQGKNSTLLYANRTPSDVVFDGELGQLAKLHVINVYSDPPKDFKGARGYVTAEVVQRLVPDFKERDIYLCGPPLMMDGVIDGLLASGLSPNQLHYERFSLHN